MHPGQLPCRLRDLAKAETAALTLMVPATKNEPELVESQLLSPVVQRESEVSTRVVSEMTLLAREDDPTERALNAKTMSDWS